MALVEEILVVAVDLQLFFPLPDAQGEKDFVHLQLAQQELTAFPVFAQLPLPLCPADVGIFGEKHPGSHVPEPESALQMYG